MVSLPLDDSDWGFPKIISKKSSSAVSFLFLADTLAGAQQWSSFLSILLSRSFSVPSVVGWDRTGGNFWMKIINDEYCLTTKLPQIFLEQKAQPEPLLSQCLLSHCDCWAKYCAAWTRGEVYHSYWRGSTLQQLLGSHVTLSQTRLLTLDVNSIYMRELETVKII